jgi:hypothetical protein
VNAIIFIFDINRWQAEPGPKPRNGRQHSARLLLLRQLPLSIPPPPLQAQSQAQDAAFPPLVAPEHLPLAPRPPPAAYGDDDDFDADGADEEDDVDNEQDYDVDYDRFLAPVKPRPPSSAEEGDIAMVAAESFVSTQDSASDTVVEDEFHKISLLTCDFFIRKVPDPDDDVFDFREVYVCSQLLLACYCILPDGW